jgi:hypothetical protein
VYNYPGILKDPGPEAELQAKIPTLDTWQLRKADGHHELWWNLLGDVWVGAGKVASAAEAAKAAGHLSGNPDIQFHAHVWIDDVRTLWRGVRKHTRAEAADTVMRSSRERGLDTVAAREQLWRDNEPTIASALEQVDWDEILKIPGAPATQCLLIHRLKSRRLSGWSRAHGAILCPHCPEAGADGGLPEHFMWACPGAQRLWTALRNTWNTLRSERQSSSDENFQRSIFQLHLEVTPDQLCDLPEMRRLPTPTPADTSAMHQALQAIWRLQVMATFHTLWRWRTAADAPQELWQEQQAAVYHEGCLRTVLVNPRWPHTSDSAASCHTAAMVEVMRHAHPGGEFQPAATEASAPAQYLLFFDG